MQKRLLSTRRKKELFVQQFIQNRDRDLDIEDIQEIIKLFDLTNELFISKDIVVRRAQNRRERIMKE